MLMKYDLWDYARQRMPANLSNDLFLNGNCVFARSLLANLEHSAFKTRSSRLENMTDNFVFIRWKG